MFKDYANYWIKTFITNVFVTYSVLRSQKKALRNMNAFGFGTITHKPCTLQKLSQAYSAAGRKQTQVG